MLCWRRTASSICSRFGPTATSGLTSCASLSTTSTVMKSLSPSSCTARPAPSFANCIFSKPEPGTVIAIDPEQPSTTEVLFAGLRELKEPRFISWAEAVADIGEIARRAKAAGIGADGPLDGSRRQADGSLLEWKTLRPTSPLALVPFFIAWGKETHPSQTTPRGCRLLSFTIEHPQAEEVRKLLAALGTGADVRAGPAPRLIARLETPKGEVEL